METKMPKSLAINGKVISIERIGEKTQAQFAAQLKQNGIVLEEERLKAVYSQLHDMAVKIAEQEQAQDVQEAETVNENVEPTNTEE